MTLGSRVRAGRSLRLALPAVVLALSGCYSQRLYNPPLHEATARGDLAEVQRLLEEGTDPNLRNERGDTALYYAVQMRRWDVGDLLLRSGTDIDAKDSDGKTVLDRQTEAGVEEGKRWLLRHGAQQRR